MSLPLLVELSHIHVIPVFVIPMLSTCLSARYSFVSSFVETQRSLEIYLSSLPISGNLEITMEFLVEIDKLVQLIESPIFACKSPIHKSIASLVNTLILHSPSIDFNLASQWERGRLQLNTGPLRHINALATN